MRIIHKATELNGRSLCGIEWKRATFGRALVTCWRCRQLLHIDNRRRHKVAA
jgi:hypothetical protein